MGSLEQSKSSAFEQQHPVCPTCKVPMWMVEVSHYVADDRQRDIQQYECKVCGAKAVVPPLARRSA